MIYIIMQTSCLSIHRPTLAFSLLSSQCKYYIIIYASGSSSGSMWRRKGGGWSITTPPFPSLPSPTHHPHPHLPHPDASTIINSASVAPLCWFCNTIRDWNHNKASSPAQKKAEDTAAVKRPINKWSFVLWSILFPAHLVWLQILTHPTIHLFVILLVPFLLTRLFSLSPGCQKASWEM